MFVVVGKMQQNVLFRILWEHLFLKVIKLFSPDFDEKHFSLYTNFEFGKFLNKRRKYNA